MLNKIINVYEEESFLKADGFDQAIIGVEESTMRLIYSVSKCLEILMSGDDVMCYDEAVEHFEYNVKGSYMGPQTPIWSEDNF